MPAKKRSNAAATPAKPISTTSQPTSSSSTTIAPASEKLPSLPLAQYYSLVPLHLGFSLFATLFLPSRTFILSQPSSTSSSPLAISTLLDPLIHRPLQTMAIQCAAVSVVQLWWGRYLRRWRKEAGKTREQVRREREEARRRKAVVVSDDGKTRGGSAGLSTQLFTAFGPLLDALLILLPSTLLIHTTTILHGAPFFSRAPHTFLLSLLIALQALFPTAYVVGWNRGRERGTWVRMFSAFEPRNDLELALLSPAIATAIGTWLGAIPIPLDWDRPWQRYPTTCVVGSALGHAFGIIVAMVWIAVRSVTMDASSQGAKR